MKRIKNWEELTIQDNFLFQKVMRNKRLCQYLIEKILKIKIADITYPDTEKAIDIRLDSKSVRLDVYVQDDTGRVFNIEMQCTDEKDNGLAKRTRYYQAMIDMEEDKIAMLLKEKERIEAEISSISANIARLRGRLENLGGEQL